MTDRDRLVQTRISLRKLIQAEPRKFMTYDSYAYWSVVAEYRTALEDILKEGKDDHP